VVAYIPFVAVRMTYRPSTYQPHLYRTTVPHTATHLSPTLTPLYRTHYTTLHTTHARTRTTAYFTHYTGLPRLDYRFTLPPHHLPQFHHLRICYISCGAAATMRFPLPLLPLHYLDAQPATVAR